MTYLWAALLLLTLAAGWLLNLVSLPGNWLVVLATAVYAVAGPAEGQLAIGYPLVAVLLGMALLGELLEMGASSLGTVRAGGSRRGAVLALAGSLVGGLCGAMVGVPLPVVGPLVGAVVFAGAGALAGAVLGELWRGRTLAHSWSVGQAAFWGRLLGTAAKTTVGAAMVAVAAAGLVVG